MRRGVGHAVSLKNLAFSEGFDDYAEVRVTITAAGVEVHTAAAEVGQGLVTAVPADRPHRCWASTRWR